jgi:hypothetical protein
MSLICGIGALVIAAAFTLRHRRREVLPIEVGCDDVVARPQRLDHGVEQRVVIAVRERMAMNDLE